MLDMIMNYTIDYVQAYSNIVEYAEDVLYLIKLLINNMDTVFEELILLLFYCR